VPDPTRVVIAEDEAIIRLDLKELLEEEGYEVVGETGRGDEAIELVRQNQPDLVILDIKMPGMDGLTAARHITSERLAAVLVLTAFSQRDLVEQARDAGALAYLVKPFQKSDLIPAIEMALGRYAELASWTSTGRPNRKRGGSSNSRPCTTGSRCTTSRVAWSTARSLPEPRVRFRFPPVGRGYPASRDSRVRLSGPGGFNAARRVRTRV
jgi:DNA-binding NarL/FixJ family response regulator